MKILYIHGFLSNGNARKASVLKKHFGQHSILAPSLPVNPMETTKIISDIYNSEMKPDFIIGSSLGGFYANHFQKKYNTPCILLNPSIKPHITLKEKFGIGKHINPDTEELFILKEEDIVFFENIYNETVLIEDNPKLRNLIICKNDELLPFEETLSFYKERNTTILLEEGGHKMENFEEQIPIIKKIINEYSS
jgi:uncharacterized protein